MLIKSLIGHTAKNNIFQYLSDEYLFSQFKIHYQSLLPFIRYLMCFKYTFSSITLVKCCKNVLKKFFQIKSLV